MGLEHRRLKATVVGTGGRRGIEFRGKLLIAQGRGVDPRPCAFVEEDEVCGAEDGEGGEEEEGPGSEPGPVEAEAGDGE